MALIDRTFNQLLNFTRGTEATRISPTTGFIVGVDFSTTSNTIGTGSKTFTLTADANVNREWTVGENVLVTAQAGATGTMTGVVTSYTPSTQVLVINVPVGGTTGSGTSTDWRIGSLEVRRDANGLLVETAATNTVVPSLPTVSSAQITNTTVTTSGIFTKAVKLTTINSGNDQRVNVSNVIFGSRYSITIYCQKDTANGFFIRRGTSQFAFVNLANSSIDFSSGGAAFTSGLIDSIDSGWFRVILFGSIGDTSAIALNIGAGSSSLSNNASDAVIIGGIQFESSPVPTSYIPTTTVSWTRNADTVTFNSTALQNVRQGQGVIYVDADFPASTTRAAALSLTGTNSEISLARQSSGTTSAFSKMAAVGNVDILALSAQPNNYVRFNGKTYTPMATGTAQNMNAVAYDGSTQVLIAGNSGRFSLSSDAGATWTNFTTADITNLNGAAYGAGTFVVVGNAIGGSGYIATIDADGTVTRRVSGTTASIANVKFVGGAFYALNQSTKIQRSIDGVTYSSVSVGAVNVPFDITFGDGLFVLVADSTNSFFSTSTDGVTFSNGTSIAGAGFPNNPFSIDFANGVFIVVGTGGKIATGVKNGTTVAWTLRTSGTTQNLTSVMYSTRDSRWYAAGNAGTLLFSEDNGVTWYSVNEAMQGYVLNNSTLQANATSRGNRDGRNRFALSFNTNSVKVAANGNMVLTDTSASIGSITAVTLGENFNGTIRNIRFFPQAKTDSEVVQISLGSTAPGINDTLQINAAGDTLQINAAGDTLRIN